MRIDYRTHRSKSVISPTGIHSLHLLSPSALIISPTNMPISPENVAKLYGSIAEHEDARLQQHPMERELTLRAIRRGLATMPTAFATRRIADIGGGPGKLAFRLADEGHHVDLIDLTPELIQLAQAEQAHRESAGTRARLASITVGNALDNPPSPALAEASYDVVLLLGPLYHLVDETERKMAVENAFRLAKPKTGLIFCAFVTIEAHLRDLAMREPARILEQRSFYEQYVRPPATQTVIAVSVADLWCSLLPSNPQLSDGRYQKLRSSSAGMIQVQSFHTRSGDARSFLDRNFSNVAELIELRSVEGILSGGLDARLAEAPDDVMQAWADLMFEKYSGSTEQLGCADHLLAVLRKR